MSQTHRSTPILSLLTVVAGGLALGGCTEVEITAPPAPDIEDVEFAPELGVNLSQMEERPSGLWLQDLEVGDGKVAEVGDFLTAHYEGWLVDGSKFDSSLDRGSPIQFGLGANNVIPGWEEGLQGMKEGGVRLLVIPPELAYGAQSNPGIPANSILVFEVELVEVRKPDDGS